jgi:hypothetical protein
VEVLRSALIDRLRVLEDAEQGRAPSAVSDQSRKDNHR